MGRFTVSRTYKYTCEYTCNYTCNYTYNYTYNLTHFFIFIISKHYILIQQITKNLQFSSKFSQNFQKKSQNFHKIFRKISQKLQKTYKKIIIKPTYIVSILTIKFVNLQNLRAATLQTIKRLYKLLSIHFKY